MTNMTNRTMTDRADKPLRLTAKRRHAAAASRRMALGLSVAIAAALASVMADPRQPAEPVPPATPAPPESIVIRVIRQRRTWASPPQRSVAAPAASVTTSARRRVDTPAPQPTIAPVPVVSAAPPTAPPTTMSRAS